MLSHHSDYLENEEGCYAIPCVVDPSYKEETPMEKNYLVYAPSYGTPAKSVKTEETAWETAKKYAASRKLDDIQVYQSLGYVKQPIPEFDVVKF